jgi:transcriptional regulator with XRE-family HTH domain
MLKHEPNKTAHHRTSSAECAVLCGLILSKKISLLFTRHGLSARAVAKALQLSNSTVTGWTKTARPQPAQAKQLAEFFGVDVEDLLDDARELPAHDVKEEPARYLAEAPIRNAGHLAQERPANQRQQAFEEYLEFLQQVRATAEAFAPNDPAKAAKYFDKALATWLAAKDTLGRLRGEAATIMHPSGAGKARTG